MREPGAMALDQSSARSRVSHGRGHAMMPYESLDLSLPHPKDLKTEC